MNLIILTWLFSSGFRTRPRKLKVVINPRSRKGQARLVYLKQVAPLFERAGIKADIMSKLKAKRLWSLTFKSRPSLPWKGYFLGECTWNSLRMSCTSHRSLGRGHGRQARKPFFLPWPSLPPYFVISPDALPINLLFCFPQSSQDYFGDPKQKRLFMSVYCSYQKFDYLRCPVG